MPCQGSGSLGPGRGRVLSGSRLSLGGVRGFSARGLLEPQRAARKQRDKASWAALGLWVLRDTRVERTSSRSGRHVGVGHLGGWVFVCRVAPGAAWSGPGGDKPKAEGCTKVRPSNWPPVSPDVVFEVLFRCSSLPCREGQQYTGQSCGGKAAARAAGFGRREKRREGAKVPGRRRRRGEMRRRGEGRALACVIFLDWRPLSTTLVAFLCTGQGREASPIVSAQKSLGARCTPMSQPSWFAWWPGLVSTSSQLATDLNKAHKNGPGHKGVRSSPLGDGSREAS